MPLNQHQSAFSVDDNDEAFTVHDVCDSDRLSHEHLLCEWQSDLKGAVSRD